MKSMVLFTIVMFPLWTSCVYDETLEEIQKESNPIEISTVRMEKGRVNQNLFPVLMSIEIQIANQTEGLYLEVEGLKLCNVHTSGEYLYIEDMENGCWNLDEKRDTLSFAFEPIGLTFGKKIVNPQGQSWFLLPQTTFGWQPIESIFSTIGSYLLLKCRISHNGLLIWGKEGGEAKELAIPWSIKGKAGDVQVCSLEMKPNCEWYNVEGDIAQRVLVPITFSPTIDDWETEEVSF